jgi:hypothetical protein
MFAVADAKDNNSVLSEIYQNLLPSEDDKAILFEFIVIYQYCGSTMGPYPILEEVSLLL